MVLRVDSATVAIFSVLLSPALVLGGALLWDGIRGSPRGGEWAFRDGALLCGIYVAALYWICGRTVELVPGRLIYRVFFLRRVIDVSNVVAASVVSRPAPTLELRHKGSRKAVAAFIIKPFSRAGVAAILLHIRESSPEVKLDRVAEDMSEGRFDTVTRETLKAMNLWRLVLLVAGTVLAVALVRVLLQ